MRREIELSGKIIPLEVNAATPIHYRNCFNEDMLAKLDDESEHSVSDRMDTFGKMAYVCMRRAEGKIPTDKDYLKWLETIELDEFYRVVVMDMMNAWYGNLDEEVEPKKK